MASTKIILPKKSKAGIILSFVVGIIFTVVGLLIYYKPLQRGQCEYLCLWGSCLFPLHTCTSQELFFWQMGFLFVGVVCLLLGIIALIQRKIE